MQDWTLRAVSVVGAAIFIGLAWVLSENRRAVSWRILGWGIALQIMIAIVMLKTPIRDPLFTAMKAVVDVLTAATIEGAKFLFGNLTTDLTINAVVAFQVLPVIILVSAISGVLYHLHVIQIVVRGLAWLMRRTLKTSGAETFGASLLVFLGIESMTALRGYLSGMTRSELFTVMTTFMATIAGSVMIIYANFGAEPGHLLTASILSAPAAILISKLMVPETSVPQTHDARPIKVSIESHNVIDAASRGTAEGLNLSLHVGAMLIAFIGIVYLLNLIFVSVTGYGFTDIMAAFFYPFAFLFGLSAGDIPAVSKLLATKTVLNEFIAYVNLQSAIQSNALTDRGRTIATYALCGFANPGSMGVLIAGLSGLVPERRSEISSLAVRALVAGTLACFVTACIAGILI